jgi:hypothetical protein
MYEDDRILDSYQNEVTLPAGNESVEAIAHNDPGVDDVAIQNDTDPYADFAGNDTSDSLWDTDEEAERVAKPVKDRRDRKRDAQGKWIRA